MKCCVCAKEINIERNEIPPKWYGRYQNAKPIDLICAECISKKENREKWV